MDLTTVMERSFVDNSIRSKNVYPEVKVFREPPTTLKVGNKNPEEMGYQDLSKYIRRLKRDGHDVRRYLVDLYNKMAFPFINLIMVFVAFSVGLRYSKTKHIAMKFLLVFAWAYSIGLSITFVCPLVMLRPFRHYLQHGYPICYFSPLGIIGVVTLRT